MTNIVKIAPHLSSESSPDAMTHHLGAELGRLGVRTGRITLADASRLLSGKRALRFGRTGAHDTVTCRTAVL